MSEIAARYLLVFTSLFVVVDPLGTVPLLLGLTRNHGPEQVRAVIMRAILFAAGLLAAFALVGAGTLSLLRINLDAFRVAGGVLLFLTALEMMRGGASLRGEATQEHSAAQTVSDVSFVPLGMPSLAGPGALTTVIVFSTDHTSGHLPQALLLLGAIVLVFFVSYWILRLGAGAQRWLGSNGLLVLSRIMGLFLAALSIQFAVEGVMKLAKVF